MEAAQSTTIKFSITGNVVAASFPPWIRAHAHKLGIRLLMLESTEGPLLVEAAGLPEMLDALMIACLLGPSDVLVEDVVRHAP